MNEFHVKQFPQMRDVFLRDGFGVVPNVIPRDEMLRLSENLLLNERDCKLAVSLNPGILEIARELVGFELTSPGGIANGTLVEMGRGAPDAAEWNYDAPYAPLEAGSVIPIWRFAVYFADYVRYSGGLGVMAETHRGTNVKMRYVLPTAVMSLPGDVVVWNVRTLHRACMKNGSKTFAPIRNAIYFEYGSPGPEMDRYAKWKREKIRGATEPSDEVVRRARRENLIYPAAWWRGRKAPGPLS